MSFRKEDHLDYEPSKVCVACEEYGLEVNMVHLEEDDEWFHTECARSCRIMICGNCSKIFDTIKYTKCPACNAEDPE
jgi:hypothetical protein